METECKAENSFFQCYSLTPKSDLQYPSQPLFHIIVGVCFKTQCRLSCTFAGRLVEVVYRILVDGDASGLVLLGLGDRDGQDSVLEVRGDALLLDACGEAEAARELADAALREPVLGLVGGLLLLRCLLGGRGSGDLLLGLVGLVFDGRLVRVATLLAALGDGAAGGVAILEVAGGRRASRVRALDAAADEERLRVSELDVDLLLL